MEHPTLEPIVDGSLPPSRPSKEDVHREQTVLAIQKVEPIPTPAAMSENEYRLYSGESATCFVNDDVMRSVETHRSVVHCRRCMDDGSRFGVIKAARLFITYEEDPLGVIPALCHAICHKCGFTMIVNMRRKVDLRTRDQKMMDDLRTDREMQLKQFHTPKILGQTAMSILNQYRNTFPRLGEYEQDMQKALTDQLRSLVDATMLGANPPILTQPPPPPMIGGGKPK